MNQEERLEKLLEAVLFDFDGVIADSENTHVAAWERAFGELGWPIMLGDLSKTAEVEDRAFLQDYFARHEVPSPNIDAWLERKAQIAHAIFESNPKVYPGVIELIKALSQKGIRLGVVSVTHRRNLEAVLKAHQVFSLFELFVGKEDVVAHKPSPECYFKALVQLKIDPVNVAVIEDSPTGLAAAKAAGTKAIAVGHRHTKGDWVGDAPYLPNFLDLEQVLQTLEQ